MSAVREASQAAHAAHMYQNVEEDIRSRESLCKKVWSVFKGAISTIFNRRKSAEPLIDAEQKRKKETGKITIINHEFLEGPYSDSSDNEANKPAADVPRAVQSRETSSIDQSREIL